MFGQDGQTKRTLGATTLFRLNILNKILWVSKQGHQAQSSAMLEQPKETTL